MSFELKAKWLADKAVESLIAEVSLTPKPGLVDKQSSNAHNDMDWALLVDSANVLYPTFYQIAKRAINSNLDQSLREDIAQIGRDGEVTMLKKTNGINTHKGAIWILGLMIAVLASQPNPIDVYQISKLCGQLASFKDRRYQKSTLSKGEIIKKQYAVRNALEEAQLGFPSLMSVLNMETTSRKESEQYWIERLLQLMSVVQDTCIISRSDIEMLHVVQDKAKQILKLGMTSELGKNHYRQLCDFCLTNYISPGGSADLLSAMIFLDKLGVINGTVTF